MTHLIKVGGAGIIASVLAIFLFILWQVIPLFAAAKITPIKSIPIKPDQYEILGVDEWGELPFVLTSQAELYFIDLVGSAGMQTAALPIEFREPVAGMVYDADSQTIVFATTDAKFSLMSLAYQPQYSEVDGKQQRKVTYSLTATPWYDFEKSSDLSDGLVEDVAEPVNIIDMAYGSAEEVQLIAAITKSRQQQKIQIVSLSQESSLLSEGEFSVDARIDISSQVRGEAQLIRVNEAADTVIVTTQEGMLYFFRYNEGEVQLRQQFKPFETFKDSRIASLDFLLGGVSLYVTHADGTNYLYSLSVPPGHTQRVFQRTKEFPVLPGPMRYFSKSLRNKAILVGTPDNASIRYGTTAEVRWSEQLPFNALLGVLSRKYQRLVFLDRSAQLHLYAINDPHPAGGMRAFFSKIWYEGGSEPTYTWQSTGGSDAFEPKLSIIPLLIGTLKGTFYAMIFALPIALLAGLYTSQFMRPNYKRFVKPIMEIMASLPSVILGFLAALWLAPLIENKVPSILLIIIVLPLSVILIAELWQKVPKSWRRFFPEGMEAFVLIPCLIFIAFVAWSCGPFLESYFFGDFRVWWTQVTGGSFEQRNSLVVGFIMGFAVIPIIFTISEDALSSVPMSLRSAALALGASRWQTAWRVVVPTAAAGIFSAVMIGLGRAVGETMIVLMATGNTPISDFNIFSGFRTLSANLAVELPEAPFQGTLYRTLFLGAMVLFLMTFILNTAAEILRQHIRNKYKSL